MHFAKAAGPQIRSGEQVAQWHEWVEIEHDNLRAALEWSLSGGEFEPGLCIVGLLWQFWMDRGHAPEGQAQAARFLARPEAAAQTYLRAKALHTAGACAFYHGRYRAALTWHTEAAAIARKLGASGKYVLAMALIGQGYTLMNLQEFDDAQALNQEILMLGEELQDDWAAGHALCQLAHLAWQRGDVASARQHFLGSFERFQADGRGVMRGPVLMNLGTICFHQGDYAAANAYLRQSLLILEQLDDKVRSGSTLTRLGHLAMAQGNDREAEELLAKALLLIGETGHLHNRIIPLNALGLLAQRQGDYARAHVLHQEALTLSIEMESPTYTDFTLEAFAYLSARQGQAEAAARLFGATEVYSTRPVLRFDPTWRLEHDQCVALARAQMGEATFAAAWAAGAAMTLDEAVALVEAQPQI
jgi:tetratricopeptide (TPR) repeat protein